MNIAEQIREKIGQLQEQLLTANPAMPALLQDIHRQLTADPEVMTILSEEEVNAIVNGLMKHTQTEIIAAAVKTNSRSKSVKSISLDDL